jgi:hypothetical protein
MRTKESPKKSVFLLIGLVGALALMPSAQAQISITMSVNGFYGENYLSDGATLMPTGTTVKLGVFYSGTALTSVSSVSTLWEGLSGDMSAKLATFDDTFYSLAESTVLIVDGASNFQFLYSPFSNVYNDADPSAFKVQSKFIVNPAVTTPTLANLDLRLKNAFVWIESADRSEFGLFASKALFPNVADEDWTLDVTSSTVSDMGVTAIAGTAGMSGVTLVPEPTTASLLVAGMAAFITIRRRK